MPGSRYLVRFRVLILVRTFAFQDTAPNSEPRTRTQHPRTKHPEPPVQYTPTVVVAAKARYGRTPLTPSHGYFSCGGSRSPSSLSRKPGTKNSLVRVVSFTRPVWPKSTTLEESS